MKKAVIAAGLAVFCVWIARGPAAAPPAVDVEASPEMATVSPVRPDIQAQRESNAAGDAGAVDSSSGPVAELARLESCYSVPNCDFGGGTPDAYQEQLNRAVVARLRALHREAPHAAAVEAARKFVRYPNDDVKEASLSILAQAPVAVENRDAVVAGLLDSVSAPLYEQGLAILEAHQELPGRERIDDFLIASIERGGHFVSEESARAARRFLTRENAARFERLATSLPARTKAREYLLLHLREFRRQERGG